VTMLSRCDDQAFPRRARLESLWILSVIVASFTVSATPTRVAGSPSVSLSGRIIGATGKHAIYVALWDSDGFLNRPKSRFE
jgi:hypothetical protein